MIEHPWPDWRLTGPRTCLWVCRFICENGATPLGRHQLFKTMFRLTDADVGVVEHEECCRILQEGVCYDQLNVASLASFEAVSRSLQVQEERYRHHLNEENDDEGYDRHLFLGNQHSRGNLCVCPLLQSFVAAELARKAALAKERRKAREERALPKPSAKKPGKKGHRG